LALGKSWTNLEVDLKGKLEFDSCQIGINGQGLRDETSKAGGFDLIRPIAFCADASHQSCPDLAD